MEGSFVWLIMERVYLVQFIYNTDKEDDSIIDNYIFDSEKKAKIYFNLNIELTKISFDYEDRKYKLYTEENYTKIYDINYPDYNIIIQIEKLLIN